MLRQIATLLTLGLFRPAVTQQHWQVLPVPNTGYRVSLPPTFHARNIYGCFNDAPTTGRFLINSLRDICIHIISASDRSKATFTAPTDCNSRKSESTDCSFFEDVRVDTVITGGKRAVVEQALRTGTIDHRSRVPELLIVLPVGPDSIAVLRCQLATFADRPLMLQVAATVRH